MRRSQIRKLAAGDWTRLRASQEADRRLASALSTGARRSSFASTRAAAGLPMAAQRASAVITMSVRGVTISPIGRSPSASRMAVAASPAAARRQPPSGTKAMVSSAAVIAAISAAPKASAGRVRHRIQGSGAGEVSQAGECVMTAPPGWRRPHRR
jgi:hypothetical protein